MLSTIYFLDDWFLPMCIFQMYVFISFKVINEILPVYLLRYLFWFFIFLRQVFIFCAVLLLTLCQCAALRCYISWVCIIIKPSLYILNESLSCVHVFFFPHCATVLAAWHPHTKTKIDIALNENIYVWQIGFVLTSYLYSAMVSYLQNTCAAFYVWGSP